MSTILPSWQQRWVPTRTFREMMTERREDQREGKLACTATGTAASPTKKETMTSAKQILKKRVTAPNFKMMLPFPNF